ncbi:NADH-quinone oxidoreductase subunit NuoG [Candidatus Ishikawella capsulata]|uniref:NADH-quinone oxidoreductase n=1 Tax=Candidatus Ishikawaella capsulata Mpkobe TaxID=476281 RepID=C5WC63_9ENTR|nr:NADH-quinone oxidoreductase subunit NuoG [Candidatus Ishikawaella capsulata]BAH82919.1 NADH:ubiquinone oxidoreductase chain G [Candidatus Ishikawaella capsulata Mpkobe]
MATIHIDNKEYEVKETNNLLQACLSLGLDIPYFCWHPALGSIGACRQCVVKQYKDATDTKGQLIVSCMSSACNGTFISINDEEAKEFRKSIIELLMINHPHDCPVCEEGGNCHLQDMTIMNGHYTRKYRFTKRTHNNQNLGPFISHEMNRCITCYRCVRYYKNYCGGTDLGVYGCHDNIYFGRYKEGTLENEFSGNLVEICPTGVFTDKTYSEHYTRKWDLQFAPSICQHCSIGCNISPGERYGKICRIENRYNGSVNHYFLCDLGRFGYGYVNLQERPRYPMQLRNSKLVKLHVDQAINAAADIIRHSKKVIGIGSSRASIESNFALRELVGLENFSTGIPHKEQICLNLVLHILSEGGIYTPSLREIETYDTILVLGEDITQVGARVALAVRQAINNNILNKQLPIWHDIAIKNMRQNSKNLLFTTNVDKTQLDDIAEWSYYAPIEDQARLGFAIAHKLNKKSPNINDIDDFLQKKIDIIVQALMIAKKPLIISGTNSGSLALIGAAANIVKALKIHNKNVGITFLLSQVNSMGLSLIGGKSLDKALDQLIQGDADTVIILENDLYRHAPKLQVDKVLSKTNNVIVIDHQQTATLQKAGLIFSAASFAESDGSAINHEGRIQRFFQVYNPNYYDKKVVMLESWRWLHALNSMIKNSHITWTKLDHVIDAIAISLPKLKAIKTAAPDANFRFGGQKIARLTHRSSGRTAVISNISVHEPRQPIDNDTMFIFSMEGNNQPIAPHSQIPFAWFPGWNSPQAWNKFQNEVGGTLLYGDPGIRLFEASNQQIKWFNQIPAAFKLGSRWRIVPYYKLFGSEEMSQKSPVFQKRMSVPKLVMNPYDAAKIGIDTEKIIEFSYVGQKFQFPLSLSSNLNKGQIGLPLGMPGIPCFLLGAYIDKLQEVTQCTG